MMLFPKEIIKMIFQVIHTFRHKSEKFPLAHFCRCSAHVFRWISILRKLGTFFKKCMVRGDQTVARNPFSEDFCYPQVN